MGGHGRRQGGSSGWPGLDLASKLCGIRRSIILRTNPPDGQPSPRRKDPAGKWRALPPTLRGERARDDPGTSGRALLPGRSPRGGGRAARAVGRGTFTPAASSMRAGPGARTWPGAQDRPGVLECRHRAMSAGRGRGAVLDLTLVPAGIRAVRRGIEGPSRRRISWCDRPSEKPGFSSPGIGQVSTGVGRLRFRVRSRRRRPGGLVSRRGSSRTATRCPAAPRRGAAERVGGHRLGAADAAAGDRGLRGLRGLRGASVLSSTRYRDRTSRSAT